VQARTSDQPVYEYLAQEVFAYQEPAVQAFLTASSTLQEMSPALCHEALGLEEAERFLTLLEDRNLFVTGWMKTGIATTISFRNTCRRSFNRRSNPDGSN